MPDRSPEPSYRTRRAGRSRGVRPPDPLARLFLDVSGEVPDDASMARMRRVSAALNLHDNDALWSVLAVLEYYARLYEVMPDRIRKVGEGGLDTMRAEAREAADVLMAQHRDALARCKETIRLAEHMIHEHEERYRAALAGLNEAALDVLVDRAANRIARVAGNRLMGVFVIAAREQRARLDGAVAAFERATLEAERQAQAGAQILECRYWRALRATLALGLTVLAGAAAIAVWLAVWRG
ncbi:hypothetical protein QHI69_19500 [Burkholderia gladioli pv. gladioli]|uniref:Uncharacterized protein n=2 Tax=Burkholderia gladioli TaxID=28095 RepID=A0AAW3ET74_BURGA|nr:hypothetical protein [Burkholderia gladioli]AJX00992.1 hypothetical protein BM43_3969 [Burkholderia gladioli]KGC11024.1 hypothetical protein DM48_7534 [Burkholderia gladioli]MDJ1164080.1 hypothetical protein [Burkholderia gladioli pv. gladioli]